MKILLSRLPAPDTWILVHDIIQVCELTPDYDNSGVSAQVAASSAYEIMCLALNNVWDSVQNQDLRKTKQRNTLYGIKYYNVLV